MSAENFILSFIFSPSIYIFGVFERKMVSKVYPK